MGQAPSSVLAEGGLSPQEIYDLVANTHFSTSELEMIYHRFYSFCDEEDGTVKMEQFGSVLGLLGGANNVLPAPPPFRPGDSASGSTAVSAQNFGNSLASNGGERPSSPRFSPSLASIIFNAFDRNRKGFIDFQDFAFAVGILTCGNVEDRLKFAFSLYDQNCDGKISRDELHSVAESIFKALGSMFLGSASASVEPAASELSTIVDNLFDALDLDQDSVITFDEFKQGVINQPKMMQSLVHRRFAVAPRRRKSLNLSPLKTNQSSGEERDLFRSPSSLNALVESTVSLIRVRDALFEAADAHKRMMKGSGMNSKGKNKGKMSIGSPVRKTKKSRFDSHEDDGLEIIRATIDPSDAGHVSSLLTTASEELMGALSLISRFGSTFDSSPEGLRIASMLKSKGIDPMSGSELQRAISHNPYAMMMEQPKPGRKKHGIFIGHPNWDRMLSMMIGIRISVGKAVAQEAPLPLTEASFVEATEFTLPSHPARGLTHTYRFKDIAPQVFLKLRDRFGVKTDDYLQMLANLFTGSLSSMCEQISEGKSGSFFYFSHDGRFVIKTIPKHELACLRGILKSYYYHCMENEHTLVTQFYGCHRLFSSTGEKLTFVVMGNTFPRDLPISRIYDLKGSTVGRSTPREKRGTGVALRDLDLKEDIELGPMRDRFLQQVHRDCMFLRAANVMDYSLLVGVTDDAEGYQPRFGEGSLSLLPYRGIPQQPQKGDGGEGSSSKTDSRTIGKRKPVCYTMGIIDFLTNYSWRKFAEHKLKGLYLDPAGVSCCHPNDYSARFLKFVSDHTFDE